MLRNGSVPTRPGARAGRASWRRKHADLTEGGNTPTNVSFGLVTASTSSSPRDSCSRTWTPPGTTRPRVNRLVAHRAVSVGRSIHGGQCATRLLTQAPTDLAGSVPLRQISNHTAAKDLITIQQALLRATPGHLRRSPGVLCLVHAARTPVPGDLTAHHRGTTPNRASDTHLGQASLQPHHNRRTILNTQHPTTAHNQPLQQHHYHTNHLHPMTPPTDPNPQQLTPSVNLHLIH